MEYVDFTLRIGPRSGGGYELLVIDPPSGGEPREQISPDLAATVLRAALSFAARGGQTRAIVAAHPIGAGADEDAVRDLGAELFHALVRDEVYACYKQGLERAKHEGKGMRLRLRIEAPELAAVPWEFIFDPRIRHEHLGLSINTPIVRHLELPTGAGRLTLEPPIRLLGMVGAGDGLDVERERNSMRLAVEHLIERGVVSLDWVDGSTASDLQRATRRRTLAGVPTHVFHFIGHGACDEVTGEGVVYLREAQGIVPLRASDLAVYLGDPLPRLVVLNSCEGARVTGADLYSSTGATLASRGVGAVVSMQYMITETAAQKFSEAFYEALADGAPVDFSLAQARQSIRASVSAWEWATPVLHMRTDDGELFKVDLAGALFPKPEAPSTPRAPAAAPAQKTKANAEAHDNLDLLAKAVRSIWIDGRLNHALQRWQRLDIAIRNDADAVRSPWADLGDTGSETASLGGDGAMSRMFENMGSALLVLGEPGSGKTVALLELARDLLDARAADASRPVPVVFTLSSWVQHNGPLDDWIAGELAVHYRIPRAWGKRWIADNRIIPLLDGLDEVVSDRRADCARAINGFCETAPAAGVVVCSRLKEYLELPVRLVLNGAIRLQALTDAQVLGFIAAIGERLAGLDALLRRDSAMARDARSPLMLGLMAEAFEGMTVAEVANSAGGDITARRKKVMDQFIARSFARARQRNDG